MTSFVPLQRSVDRPTDGGGDAPARARSPVAGLLALQRDAGNRAVADLVANGAGAAAGQPTVLRDARKQPAGAQHPDGARPPADGQHPGGSTQQAGGRPTAQPAGAGAGNEPAASPMTPQKQALIDSGRVNQVNVLFDVIQKVRAARIDSWAQTAGTKETRPLSAALEVAVAMVALGSGGVLGMLLTGHMREGLYREFLMLSGLEGGDLAVLGAYHSAMSSTARALQQGTLAAMGSAKVNVQAALIGDQPTLLAPYVEAVKLQTITEQAEQAREFNASAPTSYGTSALADRYLALESVYKQLLAEPEIFHKQLSAGYLRLLDENTVTEHAAASYGGDRAKTRNQDASLEEGVLREGVLRVCPTGGFPGGQAGWSLGTWRSPNLGFADFDAWATGAANTKTLMKLAKTPIKELPLTLDVFFWAENPYTGWLESPMVTVGFIRNPDGTVQLARDLGDEAKEWLASYHSGITGELTAAQRETLAPLGAQKLYDATKDKPIAKLANSNLF